MSLTPPQWPFWDWPLYSLPPGTPPMARLALATLLGAALNLLLEINVLWTPLKLTFPQGRVLPVSPVRSALAQPSNTTLAPSTISSPSASKSNPSSGVLATGYQHTQTDTHIGSSIHVPLKIARFPEQPMLSQLWELGIFPLRRHRDLDMYVVHTTSTLNPLLTHPSITTDFYLKTKKYTFPTFLGARDSQVTQFLSIGRRSLLGGRGWESLGKRKIFLRRWKERTCKFSPAAWSPPLPPNSYLYTVL